MLPYIAIFTITLLCSFLDLASIPRIRILFAGLCVLLTLFVATRLVGPDLYTYESFYKIIPPTPYLLKEFMKYTQMSVFEPAFLLLNGIFKSFNLSFETFIFIFSSAFMFLFIHKLERYTSLPFCALLVFAGFVYMTSFSAIRQIMASAIFFYGLDYLLKGKRQAFLLLLLLALLFHFSAICLFIFYFIGHKRISTRTILIIFLALIPIVVSGALLKVASSLLKLIPIFPGKFERYLNDPMPFWGSVSLFWVITLGICLIYRDKLEMLDKKFNLFFNILWIGLAIYIVATNFGGFGRVLLYFKLGFIVILPLFVVMIKEFYGKVLSIICIGIVSALLYFSAILMDTRYFFYNRYLPYKTWLLHEKN